MVLFVYCLNMTTRKANTTERKATSARIRADLWRELKLYSIKKAMSLTDALEAAIEGLLKKA